MKKKQKSNLLSKVKLGSMIVIGAFLGVNALAVLGGLMEGGEKNIWADCYDAPTRIGVAFPGFKLGCYLAQPSDQNYYDYESYNEQKEEIDKDERIEKLRSENERMETYYYLTLDKLRACQDKLENRK